MASRITTANKSPAALAAASAFHKQGEKKYGKENYWRMMRGEGAGNKRGLVARHPAALAAAGHRVVGPRGGVYEVSASGKKHSVSKAAMRGGRKGNAANHEGGLVHHQVHECCGGLRHETGTVNCGRVKG